MSETSSQSKSYNVATWRIFVRHMRRYWWVFSLTYIGVIAGTLTDLILPFFYKRLFDGLAHPSSVPLESQVHILVWIFGLHCLARAWFTVVNYTSSYGVARVRSDLLDTCFKYLHGHSHDFFNNSFTGSLLDKAKRYAKAFEDIDDQLVWSIVPALLTITASILILGHRNLWLGLGVLGWSLLFIGVNYWFVLYKMRFDKQCAAASTAVSGHLADTLTNHLNLKLFGGTEKEYAFFSQLTNTLFRTQRKIWDMDGLSASLQSFFMYILEFGALYYALSMWKQGNFSVGDFIFLQGFVFQIGHQLWGVGRYLHTVYEGFANASEMTEILLTGHDIVDVPGAADLQVERGAISFESVDFGYQGEGESTIFENFNLSIAPGERVALAGSSGSGKSTLIKLLFRFADIQQGAIKIDGQNIAQITQHSLRDNLSLVPQEPSLFHRSILENIRYARPEATEEEVVAAAKAAHCHEFILRFPEGYNTLVGERGVKLSGGERQRVAIARAILKNAPILILDEATSSLDSESEQLIQDALATLMEGKTTIVVAHRLSTIMQMDTIYVLDEGKIVEQGAHTELLARENGIYRKLWDIQVGGYI